ncbi:MAG: arginine repressor [Candidatus Edwardsbacteria bacterium]|jgi:transcriptional regulator of arginine metabolism|nr:arginine repressor [Candidatus Edwardsbacteria bacterium]
MSAKTRRQNLIKEILSERAISGYDQMVRALRGHGINVTEATLSRDFAELGVVRGATPDGPRYTLSEAEAGRHIDRLLGFEILDVRRNESLVVIHTLAGRAPGVARYIEQLGRKDIIGTIGGFCTVLVVPASRRDIPAITAVIEKIRGRG